MAATKEYLRNMLYEGKDKGYSHMVVVCDTWDYEDFVVFVKKDENLTNRLKSYREPNTMYRVMEIYNYEIDLEYQLDEYRANHPTVDVKTKNNNSKNGKFSKPNEGLKISEIGNNSNDSVMISFENMNKLPENVNGYIDQVGNFYIISNFTNGACQYPLDEYLISSLGFARFYRYIDEDEYGTIMECSKIPDNVTAEQLIVLQTLFLINHNRSTNIIDKSVSLSLKLSDMLKEKK